MAKVPSQRYQVEVHAVSAGSRYQTFKCLFRLFRVRSRWEQTQAKRHPVHVCIHGHHLATQAEKQYTGGGLGAYALKRGEIPARFRGAHTFQEIQGVTSPLQCEGGKEALDNLRFLPCEASYAYRLLYLCQRRQREFLQGREPVGEPAVGLGIIAPAGVLREYGVNGNPG